MLHNVACIQFEIFIKEISNIFGLLHNLNTSNKAKLLTFD